MRRAFGDYESLHVPFAFSRHPIADIEALAEYRGKLRERFSFCIGAEIEALGRRSRLVAQEDTHQKLRMSMVGDAADVVCGLNNSISARTVAAVGSGWLTWATAGLAADLGERD